MLYVAKGVIGLRCSILGVNIYMNYLLIRKALGQLVQLKKNDLSDGTITDYGTTLTMRTFELTRQGEGRDDKAQKTIGSCS